MPNESRFQALVDYRDDLYLAGIKRLREILAPQNGVSWDQRTWETFLHFFIAHWFVPHYLEWEKRGRPEVDPNRAIITHFPCRDNFEHQRALERMEGQLPFTKADFFALSNIHRLPSRVPDDGARKAAQVAHLQSAAQNFSNIPRERNPIGLGIGFFETEFWRIKWALSGFRLLAVPQFPRIPHPKVDWQTRTQIASTESKGRVPSEFWRNLAVQLPTEYLEDFDYNYALAERAMDTTQPAFLHTSLMTNTISRYCSAIASEREIPVIHNQHGSGYGRQWHFCTGIETAIADRFFSWGWRHARKNVRPGPPARLMTTLERFHKEQRQPKEILIIGGQKSSVLPNGLRTIGADPYNPELTVAFCKRLSSSMRRRIVYRFRRQHGYSEEHENYMRNAMPDGVRFDTQDRSIAAAYAAADHVILEYPNTTSAFECAALGIPYTELQQLPKGLNSVKSKLQQRDVLTDTRNCCG